MAACGEVDGSVYKPDLNATNWAALTENRKRYIDGYKLRYNAHSKYTTFDDIFAHLQDNHINDLGRKPSAREAYDQFLQQYTAAPGAVAAANNANGVSFVGHGYLPLTNGASYCDYMWGYSNFNATWTKNHKNIGPGVQKKDGVIRGLMYTQVSISGQALIFVTRTAESRATLLAKRVV
ncbi:hypothetical protein SDRG_12957 [Saprolegnia diclina VS20]|uniref:Uncharacterized protein n=1 Tax=Saprolegnia diclina (strain VS20) TaxID=1156394 RepID=T0PUT5_SAPDV|nr:hypothetical protein SDRG_12957 [Saprolegnia diclina VS20]EQC29289.1 hypothetical protein SDRG_12957 [Saprolegnia diclina VS20]|eukprot:XP_008617263.1 hypothetical protein SDRG_12957 [Saprolegnia diclina VS20]